MDKTNNIHIVLIIIVLAFALMLGGCGSAGSGKSTETTSTTQSVEQMREDAKKKRANTIYSIEVLSTAKNDENVYKVNYPWCYYAFDKANMTCYKSDLLNSVAIEELNSNDFEYIMNYIDSIPSDIGDYEGDQSFMLRVEYYDETGEMQRKYVAGFTEFPNGWGEFIDYVNKLCGGDYLSSEGEVVGVTPEFLTEVFGITDEDLKIGTLADVIKTNELDWYDITQPTFDMNVQINRYYEVVLNYQIEQYRPTSIKEVDSTTQEYEVFSAKFIEMLGDGWTECDSDQLYLKRFINSETGNDIYLGRSADLPNMSVWVPNENHTEEYCELQLDYGREGMVYDANFYYSKDYKFILVVGKDDSMDYTDIILGYIELK